MKLKLWMACGALTAQAASAGVYVEMVDHDIKANKTTLAQKIYVQNGKKCAQPPLQLRSDSRNHASKYWFAALLHDP